MPRYEYDENGRPITFILGHGLNEKRIPIQRQESEIRIEVVRAIVEALRRGSSGRRSRRPRRPLFPQVREQDVLEVFTGIRPANAEGLTEAIREALEERGY